MTKITDFKPQRRNANKHTEHGVRLLEKSVTSDGWLDAQTVAADGEMISGTARLELAADKFADVEPIVIDSDGTRPVIVRRTDIPNLDDPRAKRLSVAANQIAKTDYNPDGELLREWAGEDEDIRKMFADSEWEEVTGEYEKPAEEENIYSKKVEAPIYEIKGEKPEVTELFNDERTGELLAEIEAADIPESEKEFLRIAATRHIIFDFSKIAEYYAHAPAPVQRLMENSALVIIDFDKAIELGYVKLTNEVMEQFKGEYPDE